MALQATPYKVSLDISDVDRGVYESVKVTVARHPSETPLRLVARILAYGLFYHEHLAFGRGLSDTDEAALWQMSLSGEIEHWIDVGQPDHERIVKASRRAPQMSLLAYGNTRIWAEKTLPKVSHLKNVSILAIPEAEHAVLADSISRNMHWGLMISDGIVYVSDGEVQTEIQLQWLLRP
ncbi:YaeQ family protein [Aliidiomarina halalkaliphila]|uniref:YaeQ family protein n=1 Tax=Aliidiomarina halalkaliphila TaxID=2593535 RepID=A0A552X3H4_9GAMM|nr:YaeQ family protein [Aliidiomarina halalkaliphila]TRW49439.1 YaeQ family protein [Aliidiomarina halalkaliphila]